MSIDNMTLGDLKELVGVFSAVKREKFPHKVGECVFIRTVTNYFVGKIVSFSGSFVTLADASWIPDTGRFHVMVTTGQCNEVEPIGAVSVNINAIVDVLHWTHALPITAK